MKINGNNSNVSMVKSQDVEEAGGKEVRSSNRSDQGQNVKSAGHGSDYSVSLSKNSTAAKAAFDKAYKIALDTPSVREDRVSQLKEKIKNGEYKVDSGKIADGMIREAVRDHLAQELS